VFVSKIHNTQNLLYTLFNRITGGSMKLRVSLIAILSFIVIFSLFGQAPGQGKLMKELKLTDQQQDQFDKVKFETQKKMIELKAKTATSKLELSRLMDAEVIDKSAIEKKMNEIAANEVSIRMNHLNSWIELNKVLTPEQQKLWKKALKFRPEQMKHKMMMQREMHGNTDSPMEKEREITIERRMKN
jgi:Spy/CpxP family protein refolding chaperone